jgi:NAD(P)-dependent dehydrogenase (short-subunit alcohol dehydrogenase family)
VVDEITANGGTAMAHAASISRKEDLQGLVDATIAAWGQVDILVCNAALNPYFGPSQEISDEAYDRIMNGNVRSNLWLSQMVIPAMAARGEGSVIFISSIGGFRGSPMLGIYGVSKAADMQLVRNLAVEWGPKNVRANAIAPGLVRTDFARALWEDPGIYAKRTKDTPLKRIGEPDEIAGAAVFLGSAAGSFMTGQTIVIDGGVLAGSPSRSDD